jgi:hypothetical protein
MDKKELVSYLEKIDQALQHPSSLCVYGSAAFILLDEPDRTSLDIDIAGPYSQVDMGELRRASEAAGLPFNPEEPSQNNHVEWVSGLRLCLAVPQPDSEVLLWRGRFLTVTTVSIPDLIASKLIRYDEVDQSDVQYLIVQRPVSYKDIQTAVRRLPPPFGRDTLLLENLELLKQDIDLWKAR